MNVSHGERRVLAQLRVQLTDRLVLVVEEGSRFEDDLYVTFTGVSDGKLTQVGFAFPRADLATLGHALTEFAEHPEIQRNY